MYTDTAITHQGQEQEHRFESHSHRCHKVRVAVSRGPGEEQKRYSPRGEEEYSERDLQTVRHSSKDGEDGANGKWSGIIKTHEVIEKRNEVKSL